MNNPHNPPNNLLEGTSQKRVRGASKEGSGRKSRTRTSRGRGARQTCRRKGRCFDSHTCFRRQCRRLGISATGFWRNCRWRGYQRKWCWRGWRRSQCRSNSCSCSCSVNIVLPSRRKIETRRSRSSSWIRWTPPRSSWRTPSRVLVVFCHRHRWWRRKHQCFWRWRRLDSSSVQSRSPHL